MRHQGDIDRYAVEVLAAVFARGSEKIADGLDEERTGVVSHMSENKKNF